jgi:CRP-like cAMP-binding protein
MPMSLKEQIHLLSMVDILGPLSEEELEDLAKCTPDTYLEQGDVLYTPREGAERLFILKKGRVQVYELDSSGEEITLSVVEDGNVARFPSKAHYFASYSGTAPVEASSGEVVRHRLLLAGNRKLNRAPCTWSHHPGSRAPRRRRKAKAAPRMVLKKARPKAIVKAETP